MNKLKALLLISFLAATALLPAATLAVQVVPPYPTTFWLYGTLDKGAAPDANGYKVVFFVTSESDYASGYSDSLTGTNGEINVNAHGDLLLLPLTSGLDYYVGVVGKSVSGTVYGVNPTLIHFPQGDLTAGYKEITLTLAAGAGIPDPAPPAGTVGLTITRDPNGSDIRITWDPAVGVPGFYMKTGDGSGQYVNSGVPPWVLLDPLTNPDFNANGLASGVLIHKNQVNADPKEVYYKALQPSITDPNVVNPDKAQNPDQVSYLAQARAVGKINLELNKNSTSSWNFISTPLIMPSYDQVLGTSFTNGDQIWPWNDAEQKFYAPLTFYTGSWGSGIMQVGNGYLFNLAGAGPQTVTLVGNVNRDSLDRAIQVKTGTPSYGWNVIGNPQPVAASTLGLTVGKSAATDSIWEWDIANQKFLAPLVFDGSNWPGGTGLKIMKGYGYNHTGSGFSWQVPALAP